MIGKKTINKSLLLSILFFYVLVTTSYAQKEEVGKVPESVQKVYVGIYLMNIYDMDLASNSFYGDFYLWFKWKGDLDPIVDKEFVNAVEKWGVTQKPAPEEDTIPFTMLTDGFKYKIMRYEGRFYHAFKLNRYPLDVHYLDIQLENSLYETDDLVLLPDPNQSVIREDMKISGWKIQGFEIKQKANAYMTNFGNPDDVVGLKYSNFNFRVKIVRPTSYFVWKLLLPLFIVLFASIGSALIFPGFIDARISLPIGALLTAVFLQQAYSSNLPDIGYMVLMDKIYVLAYILIIMGLLHTVMTANWASTEAEEDYERVKKLDIKFLSGILLTFIIGVIAMVFIF